MSPTQHEYLALNMYLLSFSKLSSTKLIKWVSLLRSAPFDQSALLPHKYMYFILVQPPFLFERYLVDK